MIRSKTNEKMLALGLSPFKSAIFRTLWIAVLFSYVGAAMYDVGASWLMTSLAPNALFVSLITTATTLPIFLFALPSGILSDIFDRRSILLIPCAYVYNIYFARTHYPYRFHHPNNTSHCYFCTRSRYDFD